MLFSLFLNIFANGKRALPRHCKYLVQNWQIHRRRRKKQDSCWEGFVQPSGFIRSNHLVEPFCPSVDGACHELEIFRDHLVPVSLLAWRPLHDASPPNVRMPECKIRSQSFLLPRLEVCFYPAIEMIFLAFCIHGSDLFLRVKMCQLLTGLYSTETSWAPQSQISLSTLTRWAFSNIWIITSHRLQPNFHFGAAEGSRTKIPVSHSRQLHNPLEFSPWAQVGWVQELQPVNPFLISLSKKISFLFLFSRFFFFFRRFFLQTWKVDCCNSRDKRCNSCHESPSTTKTTRNRPRDTWVLCRFVYFHFVANCTSRCSECNIVWMVLAVCTSCIVCTCRTCVKFSD